LKEPLFSLLVILSVYNAALLLIFFRNRKGRLLLLNSIPTLLIGITHFTAISGISSPVINVITATGYFLFPLTLIFLITDYYPLKKRKHLITWSIAASTAILFSFLRPEINNEILFLYEISAFGYLLIILRDRLPVKINITLILLISPAVILSFTFIEYRVTHLLLHLYSFIL
jgi:hypothetical protein